jgi:hypothetical protein
VPPDVLAADDAGATRVPVGAAVAAVTPGAHRQAAGKVTVPVFLAFGEVDVATAPHTEVAAYTSSDDVRLLVLRGSAHCHNTATTRQILWDRLADWIAETSGRQVPTRESISGGTLEPDATRHGAHGVWEDIKGRLKSAVGAQRRA